MVKYKENKLLSCISSKHGLKNGLNYIKLHTLIIFKYILMSVISLPASSESANVFAWAKDRLTNLLAPISALRCQGTPRKQRVPVVEWTSGV